MRVVAFFTGLTLLVGLAMPAQAAKLSGTWSGSGYIEPTTGQRERVQCRVTYSRRSTTTFGVKATCASSSHSIRQTGELLMIRPNRFVGDFYNQQFDIGGRIAVTIRGSRQTVTFSSSDGGGQLSLRRR